MKNQVKTGAVLSYIHIILNICIQLLYTPVMINLLGQSEYGLYTLVGSVVSYLGLLSFGMNGAYIRFYMRMKKEADDKAVERLNGMFLCVFILLSIIVLAAGFILAQFTPQILGEKLSSEEHNTASVLMYMLVINLAITFPISVFDSIVSANEKFIFQKVLLIFTTLLNPLICLPLLLFGYGSVMIVTITLAINAVKLVFNIWYCLVKLNVKFAFNNFNYTLLREIAIFSSFIFINMIIDQVNWSVDKYIIGRVSGTKEVAVYGVSTVINSAFISFSSAVSSVLVPQVNRIVSENSEDTMKKLTELFVKTGRIQFMVLGLVSSGFVIFGKYFITNIYVTEEYENSYYAALLLILPSMIPLIQNIGIEIQRAVNKHKFRAYVYLAMAVINVIISIPFAVKWGSVGSAAGTALSILVANGLIINIYYHKVIGINIFEFWKNILTLFKGLIVPIILGIVIMYVVNPNSLWIFMLWVGIYTLVYVVSFGIWGMNNNEKMAVKKVLDKIRRKV